MTRHQFELFLGCDAIRIKPYYDLSFAGYLSDHFVRGCADPRLLYGVGKSSIMSASIYPSPKVSRIGRHVGVTLLDLLECYKATLRYLVNEIPREASGSGICDRQ